jgi:hypothetical protein
MPILRIGIWLRIPNTGMHTAHCTVYDYIPKFGQKHADPAGILQIRIRLRIPSTGMLTAHCTGYVYLPEFSRTPSVACC